MEIYTVNSNTAYLKCQRKTSVIYSTKVIVSMCTMPVPISVILRFLLRLVRRNEES